MGCFGVERGHDSDLCLEKKPLELHAGCSEVNGAGKCGCLGPPGVFTLGRRNLGAWWGLDNSRHFQRRLCILGFHSVRAIRIRRGSIVAESRLSREVELRIATQSDRGIGKPAPVIRLARRAVGSGRRRPVRSLQRVPPSATRSSSDQPMISLYGIEMPRIVSARSPSCKGSR